MNAFVTVQPHDLLWGLPVSALADDAPAWCVKVIRLGHPVVVRRALVGANQVAVGVRGRSRDQRYATVMALADIQRRVQPEQLVNAAAPQPGDWPALRALRQIQPMMNALGLPWGVVGSAGFELACGVPALHQGSDLDLILRTPQFFNRREAAHLVSALQQADCRIDLQLQTPLGAIALREWAGTSRQVLLKAADGARLVRDPWHAHESVA
jgi:phosphoribosyl-dephospho-CoA transferase